MITNELKGRVTIVRLALWQTFTAAVLTAILATISGGWSTIRPTHIPFIWASGLFGTVLANVSFVTAVFSLGRDLPFSCSRSMRPSRSCWASSCSEKRSGPSKLSGF